MPPIYSRRMFKALQNAIGSQTSAAAVEFKSSAQSQAHSRFSGEVDPSDTPYQSPIYGVMMAPIKTLKQSCKALVPEVEKIAGCAVLAAAHKIKGKDKNNLTINVLKLMKLRNDDYK